MEKKSLLFRLGDIFAAGIIIVLLAIIFFSIIRVHNRRMLPYQPMISEAKMLNLEFDEVTRNPDKYLEKPVIWCVQNISKGQTYYQGDSSRSIFVFNHQQMPIFIGYKHTNCTEMLLQIKGVRQSETDPGAVGVMFIKELAQ